jgi:hypothetical protein
MAAAAIMRGCDIADTAYRFQYSAQDVFTRSFKKKFGAPPARYRREGGGFANYTTRLNLRSKGDTMILRHIGWLEDYSASVRLKRLLDHEVKQVIGSVAVTPVRITDLDAAIFTSLIEAAVLKEKNGLAKLDCSVFLEPDIELISEAADPLGKMLAEALEECTDSPEKLPAAVKQFIFGTVAMGSCMERYLVDEGFAFEWRNVTGKYARCEVIFDEVCDAFDKAGPYISAWNGSFSDRFVFHAMNVDDIKTFTSFLYSASICVEAGGAIAFMESMYNYLTDAFAQLILGEIESESLKKAAEAANLYKNGRPVSMVITEKEAGPYLDLATRAKEAGLNFVEKRGPEMIDILKCTQLYQVHGVFPEKSATHFLHYIRKAATKKLYADHFFNDSLFEKGLLTLFYEKSIDFYN